MNGGKKSNGNSSHSGNYNSNSSVSISSFQTQPIDIGNFNKNVNSPNKSANGNLGSNNNGSSQSSRVSQTINYTPTSSSMSLENNTQASFNSALNYSTSVYSHHAGSINVGSYGVTGTLTPSSNPVTTTTPRSAFASTNAFGSLSASTSPIGLTQDLSNSPQQSNFFSKNQPISYSPTNNLSLQISRSFSSKLPASHGSFSSYLNVFSESAIIDDEIKDTVDDGFFEEDYVPASLGDDILTPQQVQRRDSRSQSGTLLVRPIFKTRDSKFDNEYDEQKKSVFVQDDVFLME
ncbi:hypothetical protein CANTEDRAFT_112791 [Yamadazyma tenuis ATCC 10573]|uniref:Uncharacterized protein n=2 Tax=Candida tenuis TaxID=2315449 RepID=G3AYS0_CANTC|nr:uncharacterized protein CANTEDRAFT_112791 [Yamadazyma tenuis ATCC 10573]EGV65913.1 hypothetical protein CANTEDRAFT_112791 [Yamadazyma tenuis ATCC 10573]